VVVVVVVVIVVSVEVVVVEVVVEGVVLVIVVSIIDSSTEFSVSNEHAVKKSMKIKDFFIILKIKNY
tara:strand:- start:239 stop:439 length:201 start_codon:yes stop_codon:yes gene_type:complete